MKRWTERKRASYTARRSDASFSATTAPGSRLCLPRPESAGARMPLKSDGERCRPSPKPQARGRPAQQRPSQSPIGRGGADRRDPDRACKPGQQKETAGECRGRSEAQDDPARERRADEEPQLAIGRADRDGGGQSAGLDESGQQPVAGRDGETPTRRGSPPEWWRRRKRSRACAVCPAGQRARPRSASRQYWPSRRRGRRSPARQSNG